VPRLADFDPQGLSNTVWAYATAGHASPTLFDAVAAQAIPRVHQFNPQELANTAWAFATAGHAAPPLFDAIAGVATPSAAQFNAMELASLAWGFATAGHASRCPALFDAIAAAAAPKLGSFDTQGLSILAWAYATASHPAPALLDAIAEQAVPLVGRFTAQGLANTAWAYATAHHPAPALLDAIAKEAPHRLADFRPQGLANTAWAYAALAHPAPDLLDAIAATVAPAIGTMNTQEIANTAWAYVTADHPSEMLFGSPCFVDRCIELDAQGEGFALEGRCQLHQWQLWLELEGRGGGAWPALPPDLAERYRACFASRSVSPSILQRQVAAALVALGLGVREEVITPQGYSLDALVRVGGRDVGIEVDGPRHFLGRAPTGRTLLKRRQLRAADLALVAVPYWDWNSMPEGRREAAQPQLRREYMAGRLEAELHGAISAREILDGDRTQILDAGHPRRAATSRRRGGGSVSRVSTSKG
jgi:hypothetical protein